jgi:hypothetical protein
MVLNSGIRKSNLKENNKSLHFWRDYFVIKNKMLIFAQN